MPTNQVTLTEAEYNHLVQQEQQVLGLQDELAAVNLELEECREARIAEDIKPGVAQAA
jgi:hypothetical protein